MLVFVSIAALAVVVWGIMDVARRPALVLAPKWKALWIAGMIGVWLGLLLVRAAEAHER